MARPETLKNRLPLITIFFVCASLITYVWPYISELLVYDRQAIINGELWRLFSAPLVHFSASHLCWNVLVLAAAGWLAEKADPRGFLIVCAFSAILPGLMFLWGSPELMRYGGLSGLATGAVVYLCLRKVIATDRDKLIWLTILVLVGLKLIVEIVTGNPLFVRADTSFHVLPAAHFFGSVGALVGLMWWRLDKVS